MNPRLRGWLCSNRCMVVIFGFGPGRQEDLGEVAACVCPNCHNQVLLHHVRSKKSVRLCFVPVVPTGGTTTWCVLSAAGAFRSGRRNCLSARAETKGSCPNNPLVVCGMSNGC